MHKIAIFRALYLGDMLLAVPALRALRQRFVASEISLIGLPWARVFRERYAEYVDRFVEFPGFPGLKEVEVDQERLRAFVEEQRVYRYDIVAQMHGSGPASNAFMRELKGKSSAGYFPSAQDGSASGLSLGASYPEHQHEIYRNLGIAALLGCRELDPRLAFPLWEQDLAEIEGVLGNVSDRRARWIGLHPGAKYASRRWPPAHFAALADELTATLDAQIFLTGGVDECSIVQSVIQHMRTKPINLAGRTSLGGLAALIARLALFISNDTGPAHLACALDTPSITLFGPGDYGRWAPLDQKRHLAYRIPVACSPCSYEICPIDHRCLNRIDPHQVRMLAEQHLLHSDVRQERNREISAVDCL